MYTGERSVNLYILSQSGCPKYQGKFDFRSFIMRIPNALIVPYSPTLHPFPFLDVIIPEFNSFLVIGDKTTKEIHYFIWKQKSYYKFVPYIFNFPLKYTKGHLFKLMLIQPKDESKYELWKIRDHQLFEKIADHTTQRLNESTQDDAKQDDTKQDDTKQDDGKQNDGKQEGKKTPEFDSIVVMKIIPYENSFVRIHVRISFFLIGIKSKYIGSPVIFGIDKPDTLNNLLHNFTKFAPKWVHNCEIRFIMKRNTPKDQNKPFDYNDYLFDNDDPENKVPYFQIVCQLIDKDDLLTIDLEDNEDENDKKEEEDEEEEHNDNEGEEEEEEAVNDENEE